METGWADLQRKVQIRLVHRVIVCVIIGFRPAHPSSYCLQALQSYIPDGDDLVGPDTVGATLLLLPSDLRNGFWCCPTHGSTNRPTF